MTKTKREALEKLDRIVLFLTDARLASKSQREWENYNESALIVRIARREVVSGTSQPDAT